MRLPNGTAGVVAVTLLGPILVATALAAASTFAANTPAEPAISTAPAAPASTATHPPTTNTDPVYRLYLAPTGSDANSGLRPDMPLRTLARAHELLLLAAPQKDVEVRIKQGTYTAPPTTWTFLVHGHTVSFLPIDYEYGDSIDGIAGRPVFRGDGTSGFWFTGQLPKGHSGGDARLRFYYLQVEKYDQGGLELNGGIAEVGGLWRPATAGYNGNTVVGMYFTNLGSRWATPRFGYSGIDLVNSRKNLIRGNHFVRLENSGSAANVMHGVYLAHGSSGNTVRNNKFQMISGDPIRTRNDSNDNNVFSNVLRRTGGGAQFSDWFCDGLCARRYDKPRECASHGNLFHDNDNVSSYRGAAVSDWALTPGDQQYAGAAGCANDGEKRVRTWRNK